MKIDSFGVIELDEHDAVHLLYTNKEIDIQNFQFDLLTANHFNLSIGINKDNFKKLNIYQVPSISQQEFDSNNQKIWFMPDNYCPSLIEDLYNLCKTHDQTNRVTQELELFSKYNMIDLLFFLKYLVDIMKENKIVWGVGRGSSVSSYVLFLIGVHKIDSIKYNLDIQEFLK